MEVKEANRSEKIRWKQKSKLIIIKVKGSIINECIIMKSIAEHK